MCRGTLIAVVSLLLLVAGLTRIEAQSGDESGFRIEVSPQEEGSYLARFQVEELATGEIKADARLVLSTDETVSATMELDESGTRRMDVSLSVSGEGLVEFTVTLIENGKAVARTTGRIKV